MDDQPLSFEDAFEQYKRVFPLHKGPQRLRRIVGWFDADELRISILVLVIAALVLVALDATYGISMADVLVEGHGLLMDLIVFGCLILWFNLRRDTRHQLRQYRETLEDFMSWGSEEGVLRKVGVINRLLDMAGPKALPPLDYQQLTEANLQGVYMPGAELSFANLTQGFLNGTYLARGGLVGTRLDRACLAYAVLEQADLRGASLVEADLEGVKWNGARLGVVTVGQSSSRGPRTYRTDLRGVVGLTPEILMTTHGWEDAYRDEHLACGKPTPMEDEELDEVAEPKLAHNSRDA